MTTTAPLTRIATFHAGPGNADRLAEALLRASTLVAEASGCELWLVQRDRDDPDTVRVCEMWSRFSILDASDLSQNAELLGRYELDRVGEARYVREQLGAVQCGVTHYRLRPGRNQGWAHRHGVVEEIYVVVSGSGQIKVDDDRFDLHALDAARVAPGSVRELVAGDDGLEILAFGPHSPGDGEMVSDWAAA